VVAGCTVTRFAEASARAGRAVPDDSPVDWAKERQTAENLLQDAAAERTAVPPAERAAMQPQPASIPVAESTPYAPEQATRPPQPTAPSPRPANPVQEIGEGFPWPPAFDLDQVDLSQDAHAQTFRRPSVMTQMPTRHAEFEEAETSRHQSQVRHHTVTRSHSSRVNGGSAFTRKVAQWFGGAGGRRTPLLWVIAAVALVVLLASAALLAYVLRNRQVATRAHNVSSIAASNSYRPARPALTWRQAGYRPAS
jgi:hypothetical protein